MKVDNSKAITRTISAFEFYKAQQQKKRAKKKQKARRPTLSVRKALRSDTSVKRLKLLNVPENVNQLLRPDTKVLRSGKYRRVVKNQRGMVAKRGIEVEDKRSSRPTGVGILKADSSSKLRPEVNGSDGVSRDVRKREEMSESEMQSEKKRESPILGRHPKVKFARMEVSTRAANGNGEAEDDSKDPLVDRDRGKAPPNRRDKRAERKTTWFSRPARAEGNRPSTSHIPRRPRLLTAPDNPTLLGTSIFSNSVTEGQKVLAWLLEPYSLHDFMSKNWLREPKVIRRHQPNFYKHLQLSCSSLDTMLRSNHLQYSKNIDITTYENGVRDTLNLPGRALPSQVWDFYKNGCSIRWLNPQTYSTRLWLLNSTLQEFFSCLVGANIYLTPRGTQGFAPHYDDIEAFVLQLEGRKHWRLYWPSPDDEHPRVSSRNFDQDEIGEPFKEVTLEAGDLLYFPRGVIHQACAADSHSLHITLSCCQHNTWADLLEEVVPVALSRAIADDPEFRESLPLGHHEYIGSNCKEVQGEKREAFTDKVKDLVVRLLEYLPINEGVDRMGKMFMSEALPPCLLPELPCSVYGSNMRVLPGGKIVGESPLGKMDENTKVKLLRRHSIRLVYEEDGPKIYHTADNTCEYQEVEPQPLVLAHEMVPVIASLIYAYPRFKRIGDLPMDNTETKIQLVFDLWEKGLLLTKRPLVTSI